MPARKTLYRKYRPTTLDQVVGQPQVVQPLLKAIKSGNFTHAYIFIGPRGTGKTSVARIFAHAINKFDYQIEDHYTDIIELDAASHTGVDDIRDLTEKACVAPSLGKYKVYIIDEVHMLTRQAFNALLKTLEEPPAHVVFIMATTNPEKIPITITSRSQTFTFQLADPKTLTEHLRQIADSEKIKITNDALRLVAERGGGSFRDSLSVLDQLATTFDQEITAEIVERALGLPQAAQIQQLLQIYPTGDLAKMTTALQKLLATGIQPKTVASELMRAIIAEPTPALLPLLAKLSEIRGDFEIAQLLIALAPDVAAPTASISNVAPVASTFISASPTAAPTPPPITPVPVSSSPEPSQSASALKASEASETSTTSPAPQSSAFSFSDYCESFHAEHAALCSQLNHCDHAVDSQTLHIYPRSSVCYRILTAVNNQRLLSGATSLKVLVHRPDEKPENSTIDPQIAQISAIMGTVQEVKVNNGGNSAPF